MARYTIDHSGDGLTVRVTATGARQGQLLSAFQECQEGRCDCPTDEYEKVSSLSVDADGDDMITMHLVPKSGERFDESEIDACLQHTVAKTTD